MPEVWRTAFAAASLCAVAGPAVAQAPAGATDAPLLAIELNKLETYEKGCRAYVVVNNVGASTFQSVKLDLVLFQPDGVIGKRFAIDLAPIRPAKKSVKLFDIEGLACDRVASVLVNDVLDCRSDTGPVGDCLTRMSFGSVAAAPLTIK